MKKVLVILLIGVVFPLISQGINLEDFKLSSITRKSYHSDGRIKNEATYGNDDSFIGIYTYEYNDDDTIDRIEYYSAQAVKPTYKKYIYKDSILVSIESYSSKRSLTSLVKYYYSDDYEIKREYFDKNNRLTTVQNILYSDTGLKVMAKYYNKSKKHIQDYKYYYNKDGRQVKTDIVKNNKVTKSIYTKYKENGNIEFAYHQSSDGRISQLYIYTFDENNRLVLYKKYIPK